MKIKIRKTTPQQIKVPVTFEDVPNEYDPFKHGITYSLLSSFAWCPEKFRLGYVERWTPVKTGKAMDFGNIVHAALEHVYTKLAVNVNLGITAVSVGSFSEEELCQQELKKYLANAYTADRLRLQQNPTGDPNEFDELEETHGLVYVTLESYFKNWIEDFAEVKFIAMEEEFAVPYVLKDGRTITLKGKRDAVWRPNSEKLWLQETKTKSRIDEDKLNDKMSFELQVQLYLYCLEHDYKEKPGGVVYNIIRRSLLRQKKSERRVDFLKRISDDIAERPEWYFIRNHISFTDDEIRRFKLELGKRLEAFIYAWENRNFYRESNACDVIGRICPFLCICSGSPIKGLYTRDSTFAELETV